MAFKLKSPTNNNNPFKEQSRKIVARHAKKVADYKPGPKANPTYGTAENIKQADLKERGERTNFPLKKPELPKSESNNLPPSQGGASPFQVIAPVVGAAMSLVSKKLPKVSLLPSSYHAQGPGGRGIAVSGGPEIPAATPGKGSGKIPDLLPGALKPGNNIMITDAGTNTGRKTKPVVKKKKSATNTSSSTTKANTINAGSNTNKDKSGGYLKDTKNFSLGVDTKLSTGSMPKFEKTVTNARSADYDMIKAKGRGKIDRLKTRLAKREGRVSNRVEASSMRIKSRQKRSGERYANKMEARTNTGTNPGKFESQKKLDAFEKVMDSPKATARTSKASNISSGSKAPSLRTPKSNQTVAKPSMKLNTSKQTSITIDDSKIKKGAKQAKGGGRVSKDTYQNLTGFKKLENKKPGSSKGMRRGVSTANTSIKVPGLSRGPRA